MPLVREASNKGDIIMKPYTNPIPIWLSTTMRQVRGRYSDGHGGRCAMGVLYVPKYSSVTGPWTYSHVLISQRPIVKMNDSERLSFREIAERVAANPSDYFTAEALSQFRREESIAQEFSEVPESIPVVVKEAV